MTKTKIKIKNKNTKELLEAIDELLDHYRTFQPNKKPRCIVICPLCNINDSICTKCLWMILPTEDNLLPNFKPYDCIYIVQTHTSAWNIKRLEKWKKILLEKEKK